MTRKRGERRATHPSPSGGRPTLLTPEIAEHIRKAIRGSSTLKDAAMSIGVGYRSVERWLSDGEEHDKDCMGPNRWDAERQREVRVCTKPKHEFWQFWHLVQQAEAELVVELSARLTQMAQAKDRQAILDILRRLRPTTWTPVEQRRVQIQMPGGLRLEHCDKAVDASHGVDLHIACSESTDAQAS